MNRIVLIGRLGKDPELRYTTAGKEVVEFSLAVDRKFRGPDGEKATDWFRVKAWGQTAVFVSDYLAKGRLVAVDGRMESRKYEKDGSTREIWEVTADNVSGLDRPREDGPGVENGPTPAQTRAKGGGPQVDDDWDPFADD